MDALSVTILILTASAALVLLYASGLLRRPSQVLVCAALLAGAFAIRGYYMPHVTSDYETFLSQWVEYYRSNGGFAALGEKIGNYNLPYLYFLAAISYIDAPDLVFIKGLSIVFDVVLAWAGMKLAGLYTRSEGRALAAFFLILYWPTVILNGSCWGQCDSIYAAFAVLSIYCALSGHPARGMACIAVSFAFKLQAVFIMPIFVVLLIAGMVKLRHFLIFPLAYLALMLPAVLAGYPLLDTVTLYFDQMGTVGDALNYNSSSIYAFTDGNPDPGLSALGIAAAFALMLGVFAWAWAKRGRLTNWAILGFAVVLSVGIPYLLPHMHERYFFIADILTLLLAVAAPEFLALPVLTLFASWLGYYAFLNWRFLLPMKFGAAALALVLAGSLAFTAAQLRPARKNPSR